MKIEIKHRVTGEVLFSHEQDKNALRITLEVAVSVKADLRYADLGDADLRYANLRHADLRYADLGYADLRYANLRHADLGGANLGGANLGYANLGYANLGGANLGGANLGYANLGYANLGGADLRGADLGDAVGQNSRMSCLQLGNYRIVVLDKEICWGGCTKKTVKKWLQYKGEELSESDRHYLKTVTKPFLRMVLKMGKSDV